jgi:hypothetical protein
MKRLKKWANFNTFEQQIQTNFSVLCEKIKEKDDRLNENKAKIYNKSMSIYGGIYKDDSNAQEIRYYAVEFLAYKDIPTTIKDKEKEKTYYKNYMGAVATKIDYTVKNGELKSLELNNFYQYAEVFEYDEKTSISTMKNDFSTGVEINSMFLKYAGKSFMEALINDEVI